MTGDAPGGNGQAPDGERAGTGHPCDGDRAATGHTPGGDPGVGIEVEELSVRLGDQSVLSGASLSVDPGSLVGLVGPNGAGKTTLLRTINATLAPDSGRVLVGGDDVGSLSARAVARRVATVPQDTTVPFSFPVRRIVEMGRHPHRPRFGADPDPGAVDRAMARTGVADLADRQIDAVSGGERSRVMLARALAQDAPALVLDEPTASLDVNHQVGTLDLVRGLAGEGRTVLAAIHDLDLAARYCDGIAVLSGGRILAVGTPSEVLTEAVVREAFGTEAVVVDHPVTGSPLVTALGAGGDRPADLGRSTAPDGDRTRAQGRDDGRTGDGDPELDDGQTGDGDRTGDGDGDRTGNDGQTVESDQTGDDERVSDPIPGDGDD